MTLPRALVLASLVTLGAADCSSPNTLPLEDAGEPADVDLAACVADGPIGTPRPNCPSDLPPDDDCTTASPIYDDVAPIFAARCAICHRPGGYTTKYQFDTYAHIVSNMANLQALTQIYTCRMPPSCAPNLHPDERQTLLKWLVCGAPENRDGGAGDAGTD
jgi:hypothetical protein